MRAKQGKTGVRGLVPGKFFMTSPLRSLENAPLLEIMPRTEAKDHWESFHENFEMLDFYDIASYCIFDRFWKLLRIYTSLNLHSYNLGYGSLFHLQKHQTLANYYPPAPPFPTGMVSVPHDAASFRGLRGLYVPQLCTYEISSRTTVFE